MQHLRDIIVLHLVLKCPHVQLDASTNVMVLSLVLGMLLRLVLDPIRTVLRRYLVVTSLKKKKGVCPKAHPHEKLVFRTSYLEDLPPAALLLLGLAAWALSLAASPAARVLC